MGKDVRDEAIKILEKQGFDVKKRDRLPRTKKELKQLDEMNKKLRALGLK